MATQGLAFVELLDKAAEELKLQHLRELEESAVALSLQFKENVVLSQEVRALKAQLQLRCVGINDKLCSFPEKVTGCADLQFPHWNSMQESLLFLDDELPVVPAKCFAESVCHAAVNGDDKAEQKQEPIVEDLDVCERTASSGSQGLLPTVTRENGALSSVAPPPGIQLPISERKTQFADSAESGALRSTSSTGRQSILSPDPLGQRCPVRSSLKRSRTCELSTEGTEHVGGADKRMSTLGVDDRRLSHYDLKSAAGKHSKLPDIHGNGFDSAFASGELHPEIMSSLNLSTGATRHSISETNNVLEIGSPGGRRRVTWQGNDHEIATCNKDRFIQSPEIVEEPEDEDEDDDEEEQIEMLPIWRIRRRKSTVSNLTRAISGNFKQLMHMSTREGFEAGNSAPVRDGNDTNFVIRFSSKCVAKPSSGKRLLWDLFGVMLIGYDLVWIPMQAFDPARTTGTIILAWMSTIFWTLDIPASFLVGYHNEGVLEMRVVRIARQYCRTWLPFDVIIIIIDWTLTALELMTEDSVKGKAAGGVGYMRLGKAVRFLRLLRLLRLLKASGVLKEMLERIQSEAILILVGIVKLLVLIMMINHIVACAWYALGSMLEDSTMYTWIEANEIQTRSVLYRYATSLHWSLTQFTPASMEVFPENEVERCFAVSVIISAMVAFSSFVSAITNAMTQLRNLHSERNSQFSTLRKYFAENKVSVAVMGRIYGYLQQAMSKSKSRVHEVDVTILQLLPWSLKAELLEEVYSPTLSAHPFFNQFSAYYQTLLRKLFQTAVEEISKPIGQELFISGEVASRMYFVLSGYLNYSRDRSSANDSPKLEKMPPVVLSASQWCSEPALWIKWKHLGQLLATSNCELIALKADKLGDIFSQLKDDEDQVKRYVKIFVRYFKKFPEYLHDAWVDRELIGEMTNKAFFGDDGDDEDNQARQRNSSHRPSVTSRRPSLFGALSGRVSGTRNSGRPAGLNGLDDVESESESDDSEDETNSVHSDGSTHSVKSKVSTVSKKSTFSTKSNKSKKGAKSKEEEEEEEKKFDSENEELRTSQLSSRRSSSRSDAAVEKSDSDRRRGSNESVVSKKSKAEQTPRSRASLCSVEENSEIDQWLADAEKRRSRKSERKNTTGTETKNKVSRFFSAIPTLFSQESRTSLFSDRSSSHGKGKKDSLPPSPLNRPVGEAWN